jgi:hypothetical protein|nr:MAG TPA: FAD SYNTHETASE [Caudoviricetes sp.]
MVKREVFQQSKGDSTVSKEDWGIVTMPTNGDPEKIAIGRLKAASDMALKYYGTPLVVTTSGGKDSSVCVELALRGGHPV